MFKNTQVTILEQRRTLVTQLIHNLPQPLVQQEAQQQLRQVIQQHRATTKVHIVSRDHGDNKVMAVTELRAISHLIHNKVVDFFIIFVEVTAPEHQFRS